MLACATPKKIDTPKKIHWDKVKENKGLVEYNYKSILTAKTKKGICTFDADSGEVKYGKDADNSLFIPTFDIVGVPVSLHCSDKKTIVVTAYNIIVANKGMNGSENSEYADSLGEDALDITVFFTRPDSEKLYPENITSVVSDNILFVLVKNPDKTYDMRVVDLLELEDRTFELGTFSDGAVMKKYNDMLFIAGEAKKGEAHLIVARMGDNGLEGKVFTAKKDMEGEILFEEQENGLILHIGKRKTKIEFSQLEKEIKNEKTACFENENNFDCITIKG